MLATLIIGLREGLEASLIVGMIAAFLRRNNSSLKPMWLGVGAAAFLSIAVGVVLEIVSASLPQQQQEGMETIIGVVAVVIVTFMIAWMSKNSRNMKSTLESHAGAALKGGSVFALAAMACLAVLREGIETSVFMVAAFQSSLSPLAAGGGALIGLAIAAVIGYLLFKGAIKINLAKFFKITGVFLVFVAAGLVMKALRTAHEAGWIAVGQGPTVDLSWLAPNGSTRFALLNGMFGVVSDPRVIEVLGWLLYLVPMLAFMLWPRTWQPKASQKTRLKFAAAGVLGAAAIMFALLAPLAVPSEPNLSGDTPLENSAGSPAGSAKVIDDAGAGLKLQVTSPDGKVQAYPLAVVGTEAHAARTAVHMTANPASNVGSDPETLSSAQLAEINGGRTPVGISSQNSPGPYDAKWSHQGKIDAWLVNGELLDVSNAGGSKLTLSGGGLSSSRTIVVNSDIKWHVPEAHVAQAATELTAHESAGTENVLWSRSLPAVLILAALLTLWSGLRNRRELRAGTPIP